MEAFTDLSILIGIAALLGLIANKLRQPLILGYIAAGVIMQLTGLMDMHSAEGFELFSKIGIVFLLFVLGLELNIEEMKSLGVVSLVTGVGQIVFTVAGGVAISALLGYDLIPSLILAIALTFSSTIVIVKLLSRKQDLDTLYGKISIGFLLVQDLAAILILVVLSASLNAGGGAESSALLILPGLLLKSVILVVALIVINTYLIPPLISLTGHDREVLFICTIAIALVFSAVVASPIFSLSIEIGALAAGIALSSRMEALQIESWTRPLRDFFITVFFVLLGFQIELGEISTVIQPAIIFSIFVLIGNPIIVLILLRLLGFKTSTGFKAGLTVAQISEFSLLVADMALRAGQITTADITMLTIVGGITMTGSSYMILYNQELYELLRPWLSKFDPGNSHKKDLNKLQIGHRIVIIGFSRMARSLHDAIKSNKRKFLVIDNDINNLGRAEDLGAETVFGDISDEDFLMALKLERADLVISTVPSKAANMGLVYHLQQHDDKIPVIVNAFKDADATELYEAGADFVLHPYLLVSDLLHKIVNKEQPLSYITRQGKKDYKYLVSRS